MTTTLKRFGKPLYKLTSSLDANPAVPVHIKANWDALDEIAKKTYNKPYDALSGAQKTELHFELNTKGKKDKK